VSDSGEYRFALYLRQSDWAYWGECLAVRTRRIRATESRKRAERISVAMVMATADAIPDGEEFRYPLVLSHSDLAWLETCLRFARKVFADDKAAERIGREVLLSYGSMEEA